jgi:hypothetical protein
MDTWLIGKQVAGKKLTSHKRCSTLLNIFYAFVLAFYYFRGLNFKYYKL